MALTWPDPLPTAGAVVLRPFRDADLPLIAELSADPYLPLIGTIPSPYTEAAGLAYIARQHQRLADQTGYSFAIADRADDRALGGAGLWPQPSSGVATLGYAVAPSARGRGIATAALTALTAFGWTLPRDVEGALLAKAPDTDGRLDRLELYIEPWNTGSIKAAEKAGYEMDALLREHSLIGGRRRDMVRYVKLRPCQGTPFPFVTGA